VGSPYDQRYFSEQRLGSRSSAEAILPPVIKALDPASIVDVGCGLGNWLAAAQAAGVTDVLGLDGAWTEPLDLRISRTNFRAADLRERVHLGRTFDLAICVETAEHLPPERAETLVADLVALAPVVLFSAAVPGQGGTDHFNERWADFWSDLFARHGYRCVDAIRWIHWDNELVEPWYSQNSFVYAAPDKAVDLPVPQPPMPMRVIHPAFLRVLPQPHQVSREFAVSAMRWQRSIAFDRCLGRLRGFARSLHRER
jgi:SAM-dependent methyltransferase